MKHSLLLIQMIFTLIILISLPFVPIACNTSTSYSAIGTLQVSNEDNTYLLYTLLDGEHLVDLSPGQSESISLPVGQYDLVFGSDYGGLLLCRYRNIMINSGEITYAVCDYSYCSKHRLECGIVE